ncbi:MAG: DUF1963 domain-containing protein [Oscillospiraceae bacterium]|nr:DUF1963 domain-containing protein [Oscillospiraceae bacterium]
MGIFDFFKRKTAAPEPKPQLKNSAAVTPPLTDKQYAEFAHQAAERVIKETCIPCLGITLENGSPSIYDSKAGGLPYLPHNAEIPVDPDGRQMKMLAQINCSEISCPEDFPHKGILQFWLTPKWAWDSAKVVYYENIDDSLTEDDVRERISDFPQDDSCCFPIEGEYKIRFAEGTASMSCCDRRLKALFCQYFTELSGEYISDPEDAPSEEVYNIFNAECEERDDAFGSGHHLGGYGYSTQFGSWDYDNYKQGSEINIHSDSAEVLLFQLDSDYGRLDFETRKHEWVKVMWGDAGVGRFSISRADLKKRRFDKAWFSWDCS